MIEPSPLVQELYIERFGEEAYEEHKKLQTKSLWPTIEWYTNVCQIGSTMASMALLQRRKPVHGKQSTVATGTYILAPEAQQQFKLITPDHGTLTLRHNYADTSAGPHSKSVKSMSINLGFLTLTMLSSPVAGFWNLPSFLQFFHLQTARTQGWETETRLKHNPLIWDVYQGTPYYPASYTQLHYHSLITYDYQDSTGHYLVRFCGLPAGAAPETVTMPREEVKHFWDGEYFKPEDASVPKNLLDEEYTERLKQGPQEYMIGFQIKMFQKGTAWEDRHAMKPWKVPVQPFATFMINTFQEETVSFDPNHMFPGLFVATPQDSYDTASIAYLRLGLYPFIQKLRRVCFID